MYLKNMISDQINKMKSQHYSEQRMWGQCASTLAELSLYSDMGDLSGTVRHSEGAFSVRWINQVWELAAHNACVSVCCGVNKAMKQSVKYGQSTLEIFHSIVTFCAKQCLEITANVERHTEADGRRWICEILNWWLIFRTLNIFLYFDVS